MIPTDAEIIFWFILVVLAYTLFAFLFCGKKEDLYVSEYELDRLNGNKY
jgi:hypothetical protein